jgi:MFS family permease
VTVMAENLDVDAHRRRLPLLWAATLANFTALGIFFVAIPLYVSRELDGSKAAVGLCIGVFSISAVLFRPVVGRGIDQRGRKPFLIFSLVVLTLTSLSFHLATAIVIVVVIRLAQGLGGAAYYTTCAAVTTDLAPVERRASAIAVLSLFLYAAASRPGRRSVSGSSSRAASGRRGRRSPRWPRSASSR